MRDETDSNWSSGLSIWDWLHGTVRTNIPQDAVTLGVPGYRDPRDLTLGRSLALPFIAQRDAWLTRDGQRVERAAETLDSGIFPS